MTNMQAMVGDQVSITIDVEMVRPAAQTATRP